MTPLNPNPIYPPVSNTDILNALYVIAPQFASPSPPVLAGYNTIIGLLRSQVNEKAFGLSAVLAYVYLLAHTLTVAHQPSSGVVSSLSEGELSLSYGVDANSSILMGTSYGRSFLDLIKKTVAPPSVTNLPPDFGIRNYENPVYEF